MSKWEKLIEKLLDFSSEMRFAELEKILASYGYKKHSPRSGSSHYTFRKVGCNPITIPKHEPIKKVYVQLVKEVVEGEIENENLK